MAATGDFRLSITRALGDQLTDALSMLTPAPLDGANLSTVDRRGGVYQLYHNGMLVYIGKADSSLRDRLGQHRRKIGGRRNISLSDMSFTALYVEEDFSAVAPENLLIQRHSGIVSWNTNGFGNKDPGRQRDTSAVKPNHFDALYPIDLEWELQIPRGRHNLAKLLARVKTDLPYLFRYEGSGEALAKQPLALRQAEVELVSNNPRANEVFQCVVAELKTWQATALPGYVIMYPERRTYSAAIATFVG